MNMAPFVALALPSKPLGDRLAGFAAWLREQRGLSILIDHPRLLLLGSASAPRLLLAGSRELIWGEIFDSLSWQRVHAAASMRAGLPVAAFSAGYWGSYVRFSLGEDAIEIARDPSGGIPCYHAHVEGAEIFTSRPEFLFDAGLIRPQIDWTILSQAIAYRDLRPARTALRDVSELMPGTAVTISPQGLRIQCFWSPWTFARPVAAPDIDEAAEQVRRVGSSCIAAWAKRFERPLVEVSGGLDSSIVAAGVAAANRQAALVTFASAEGDPDETPYAQAMAAHLGLELHVLHARAGLIDLLDTQARDLPRPSARAFAQALDIQLRESAAALGADAFFSGGGGDNVFGLLQSVLPAIDRLQTEGPGLGVTRTIADVASLAGVSFWEAGKRTIARALRRRAPHRWSFAPGWLSPEVLDALPFPAGHPWMDIPEDILPGKRVHGHSLLSIQNHLEGFDRLHEAPVISPLLSQPLVETCLAIPTWLWCMGGENRAVARRAFAHALPPMVRNRQTKGAFDSYCAQIFTANRRMLTMMLLEGELAAHGLLDRGALQRTLGAPRVSRTEMLGLLTLADIEAWTLAWTSRQPRQRARALSARHRRIVS